MTPIKLFWLNFHMFCVVYPIDDSSQFGFMLLLSFISVCFVAAQAAAKAAEKIAAAAAKAKREAEEEKAQEAAQEARRVAEAERKAKEKAEAERKAKEKAGAARLKKEQEEHAAAEQAAVAQACTGLRRACRHGNVDDECSMCICRGGWSGTHCDQCMKRCVGNQTVDEGCEQCTCKDGFELDETHGCLGMRLLYPLQHLLSFSCPTYMCIH
jgi:hypothetical protein